MARILGTFVSSGGMSIVLFTTESETLTFLPPLNGGIGQKEKKAETETETVAEQ